MRISAALLVLILITPLRAAPNETLEGHEGIVTALAFSPKGDRLLSVGEDGWAQVWDVKTRKAVHRCHQKDEKLFAAVWRPDGLQFATAGEGGVVRVWEVGGNKPVVEYKGHKGPVLALAFSPDGKLLASGGYMRTIRLWPIRERGPVVIQDMDGRVTSLAFTDDGMALVVGTAELTEQRFNDKPYNRYGEAGFVRVYDIHDFWSVEHPRKLDVRGSQIAVAGNRVLAVGIVASQKQVVEDGKRWLHTNGGPVLSIADWKTGKTIATTAGAGMSAGWSKDGSVIACGGQSYRHYPGNIMLGTGEANAGAAVANRIDEGDKITTRAIDPRERGPNNIFLGDRGPLTMWDPSSLKKGVVIGEKGLEAIAVSPDGKLIAVGNTDGLIRVYPTPEMK